MSAGKILLQQIYWSSLSLIVGTRPIQAMSLPQQILDAALNPPLHCKDAFNILHVQPTKASLNCALIFSLFQSERIYVLVHCI